MIEHGLSACRAKYEQTKMQLVGCAASNPFLTRIGQQDLHYPRCLCYHGKRVRLGHKLPKLLVVSLLIYTSALELLSGNNPLPRDKGRCDAWVATAYRPQIPKVPFIDLPDCEDGLRLDCQRRYRA